MERLTNMRRRMFGKNENQIGITDIRPIWSKGFSTCIDCEKHENYELRNYGRLRANSRRNEQTSTRSVSSSWKPILLATKAGSFSPSSWCLYSKRCTTMRVRRYFGSTITPRQPPGRRNGDVSEPSAWIPVDVVTNPQAPEKQRLVSIHYYHVPSKKDIPRKPDGLPLCKHCYRQLAQHFCTVCAVDYCANCHRLTHASPFGVRQKANATQKELANADCTIRVTAGSHHSRHCKSCAKDLCRPCSRRLHGTENKLKHDFYHV
mmetsp:Transcript_24132/g.33095  ORF Transcript_24132/g.33095 Transcript_24132/m.33095 type:complete len:262 (-) Transcript_24132:570-1355(-)